MRDSWPNLAIAIPTFRRNESLLEVLQSIHAQATLPGLIMVVDNNFDDDARRVVQTFETTSTCPVRYLRLGRNAGPAGAFANALDDLAENHPMVKWMLCRGDDNPFSDADILGNLLSTSHYAQDRGAVGFGLFGKRLGVRSEFSNPRGVVAVDYIPGGGVPVYDVPTLSRAGINFQSSLFFGYEELLLGLQIRSAGFSLLAGRGVDERYVIAPKRIAPWRTYFHHRNRLLVARQFETNNRPIRLAADAASRALRAVLWERSLVQAKATVLGMIDGLRPIGSPPRSAYIPSENAL